jgi:hypothetical protein
MVSNPYFGVDTIMFSELPHKKMKKANKIGFVGECDCGHQHKFKSNEIDLDKSESSTILFKNVYTCPKCTTSYNGIFESIKDRNNKLPFSPTGSLFVILLIGGLVFGGYKIISPMFYSHPTSTNINKATNKELDNFYKWDHEQQQKKRDNQPAFNNNGN